MAHFAKLDSNNKVIFVTTGRDQDNENDLTLKTGDTYKQTSYNTYGNKHMLGEIPFRKNFAGVGFTYDSIRDAFIPPKPFNSWILNEDTCLWEAPIPYPNLDEDYYWDENIENWVKIS